jgi:Zn-dependent protease with chaperone function
VAARWWIASSSVLAAGIALLAGLALGDPPAALLPLQAADRQELRDRLTTLSRRAGIRTPRRLRVGPRREDARANAALRGHRPHPRRVLVSDTLLAESGRRDRGHPRARARSPCHRDPFTALRGRAALIVSSLGLSARRSARWRPLALARPSDVAGLPLLVRAGADALATPALNLLSRHHERRADRYALALTARPAAFVSRHPPAWRPEPRRNQPVALVAVGSFTRIRPVDQRISAAREFRHSGRGRTVDKAGT